MKINGFHSINGLRQLYSLCGIKNKVKSLLHILYLENAKWIKDLNGKKETVKRWKESLIPYSPDGKDSFNSTRIATSAHL